MKKRILKYGLSALFVGLMAYFYLAARDFAGAEGALRYQLLCDAFTVPGVLLLCAGALIWVTNLGALNGIAYGLRLAVFALIPGKRTDREESYAQYVQRKRAGPARGYGFLLICGAVTVAVSFVFLVLYYL